VWHPTQEIVHRPQLYSPFLVSLAARSKLARLAPIQCDGSSDFDDHPLFLTYLASCALFSVLAIPPYSIFIAVTHAHAALLLFNGLPRYLSEYPSPLSRRPHTHVRPLPWQDTVFAALQITLKHGRKPRPMLSRHAMSVNPPRFGPNVRVLVRRP
jgi:hypothetical protein